MKTSLAVLAVCLVGALAKPRLLKATLIHEDRSGFVIDERATQHDNDFDPSNTTTKSALDCMVKVEGDILIPCEPWQPQQRTTSDVSRVKKGAPSLTHNRWPKGKIFYSYADDAFSPIFVRKIKAAMREWKRYTCLRFRFSKKRKNRVVLKPSTVCASWVGMRGGLQWLFLDIYRCGRVHGTVLHELGHVIGLQHEHTRPDRTNHVIVNHGNIEDGEHDNFIKYTWNKVENLGLPYDYDSIMHYDQYTLSKNGKKTIMTKHRGNQNRIGQRIGLSFGDVRTVSRMYGCADHCRITDADCPRGGFVHKNCRCVCPGPLGRPIKDCDE